MLHLKETLSGHQNPVYALATFDDNLTFFSAGNDKGIVEWSLNTMTFVKVLMPVQSSVYSLFYENDRLFIGERSGAFSVYDFKSKKVIARINAHTKPIFDIKVASQKRELLTASEDGTVAVWSLEDFAPVYRFQVAETTVRCIAISPDQTEIAFGSKDGLIKLYNLEDYSFKTSLADHTFAITSLSYHPQGDYLISGSRDAQLKIWNLQTYHLFKNIPAHLFSIYSIIFHPHLPFFATCSQDKSIKLWHSKSFKLYKILSVEKANVGHKHSINKLIWSNDGRYLISTGDDRSVMVWELET